MEISWLDRVKYKVLHRATGERDIVYAIK